MGQALVYRGNYGILRCVPSFLAEKGGCAKKSQRRETGSYQFPSDNGSSSGWQLHQPHRDSSFDEVNGIAHAELAHNVVTVVLDSPWGTVQ